MISHEYKRLLGIASSRYGVPAHVLAGLIEVESGFNPNATSPAGARGLTQFMPGTARSHGVHYGSSHSAVASQILGAAKYLNELGYQHNPSLALAKYNGGPGNPQMGYARNVLSASKKYKGLGGAGDVGPGGVPMSGGSHLEGSLKTTPGVDRSADRTALKQQYLLQDHGKMVSQKGLLSLNSGLQDLQDTPSSSSLQLKRVQDPGFTAGGGKVVTGQTKVSVAPGADRPGVKTSHYLRRVLSGVQGIPGGITITTGSNHNQMTTDGNVSDHWTGKAGDIAVPVDSKRGDLIAGRVLVRLGVPRAKAREMARRGGLFNVNYGGHRWQVIWKTNQGGNHHTHVHVGVR